MLVTIFSDSHDNQRNVEKIMQISLDKKVSYIFHAGDLISPFTAHIINKSNIPYFFVFGNNDGEVLYTQEIMSKGKSTICRQACKTTIENKSIVMMHEPYWLNEIVASQLHDVVIYGHTHEVDIRKENNVRIINPGESCGYLTGKATFVIYDVDDDKAELITL